MKGTIFEKGIEHKMFVLILFTNFIYNISHPKKNWARCDKKISSGLRLKYPLFLSF